MDTPPVRAPHFPEAIEWLQTGGRALSLADFRGRVLLLDFWTSGCINCLHVLPALRELEARFPEHLAVVGVHSGKFIAEREPPHLRDAAVRLDAHHPIVNDRHFRLWRAYAVRAWPTLVAIDPRGYVVGMQAGEFTADAIAPVVERLIDGARAAGGLRSGASPFVAEEPTHHTGILAFPGKVAAAGRRLAIADTAHHRVLVGTLDPAGTTLHVERIAGGPTAGYADGREPRFHGPQGMAFHDDALLIADAGNHVIRRLALDTGAVTTLAGTGRQLRSAVDEARGAMSSPWDLAVANDLVYIAMAGLHELWTLPLAGGIAEVFAGSGAEEVHDAPHAEAALAQPMGLCVDDATVWFVDAESSAVRAAERDPAGGVRTVVGTGLFDFGDVDGTGDAVRLQHPQGIARHPDGRLLVCDTYNGALKWVEAGARRVTTLVRGLQEPSGLALAGTRAYVAETNAHRIVVVDLADGAVQPLALA